MDKREVGVGALGSDRGIFHTRAGGKDEEYRNAWG